MVEKLPAVQKFLLFLSKNISALLLLLLAGSAAANFYLFKEMMAINAKNEEFKNATIEYERKRGEKLEEILHQEVKRELISKQTIHE
ncbi:hypothetical protein HGH93_21355 [Chitinophaga polysaccharea]|uniref:hypothetical protein n=1 Tax=Chitinophaga polysaccharea TaxID=1293035 RepID=UPI0014553D19|nr:hypothetical protein [Chitinophaga polysaccharea]NLR60671.1 hypothetical protein [Chitinophaga polysaccharea]